ncbi:uncharacterized protein METZ01_LOCUS248480, partial [marine metagenome]
MKTKSCTQLITTISRYRGSLLGLA